MKKIFTLIATVLAAVSVNAQETSYPFYTEVETNTYAILVDQETINAAGFDESWISAAWSMGVALPADFEVLDNDYINVRTAVDDSRIYTSGNKYSDMIAAFPDYKAYLNLGSGLEQSGWTGEETIEDYSTLGVSYHGFYVLTPKVAGTFTFGVYAGDNKRVVGIYKLATEDEIDNDYLGEWAAWEEFQQEVSTEAFYLTGELEANREYLMIGGGNKNLTMHQMKFVPGESTGITNVELDANHRTVVGYYTLGGMETSGLVKGVNIVKYSDGSSVKVIK